MTETIADRFDPLAPEQRRDPYALLERARREQPVFFAEQFGFWVVTRYEDVLAVLKDDEAFSSVDALRSSAEELPAEVEAVLAEGHPDMPVIIDTDPPEHTQLRGLITRAFTPKRIAELEPAIVRVTDELLDGFAADGRADLVERFAWPLPLRVIGEMLGVPPEDLPDLHRWSSDWLSLFQPCDSVGQQIEWARSVVSLQHYFAEALRAREAEPRDDLLTALLESWEGTGLGLDAVIGVPLDLVVAGHVTVTRALGNALLLLLDRPEALAAVRDEPDYCATAIEEILRLESPAQGLFRTTTREVSLGGSTLPVGARVMVHYGSANRDDAQFEDPYAFAPERPGLARHLAFGKGIHFCIGAPLARLELRIALPRLLERLPNLRLATGAEPQYERIFFARGLERLELAWDPVAS